MTEFTELPTGKPHVSFSEFSDWKACTYRHKLIHVLKLGADDPSPFLSYGTALHAGCENFLKTRVMDVSIALKIIDEDWEKHSKFWKEQASRNNQEFLPVDVWREQAIRALNDLPDFFDSTFPNWEIIDAEHALYEQIENTTHAFKGYIDCVIKTTNKKGKTLVWIIDFKTCIWGWKREKIQDPIVRSQLVYYKHFWAKKTGSDPKNVRCGFLLLKRTAKKGKSCQLITVSAGDLTMKRSLLVINNMLSSIKRGIALKNRQSCLYCQFKDTDKCT